MNKIKHFLLLITFWNYEAMGQRKFGEVFKVGDTVTNLFFNAMINYHSTSSHLYDFRGKVVIFDFWHTNCPSCIAQFQKIENLSKDFENRAIILPVGYDFTEGGIRKFLKKYKGTAYGLDIPNAVYNDSNKLHDLFPIDFPGIVWIDSNMIFKGVSGYGDLNQKNLEAFISGVWYPGEKKKKRILKPSDEFLIPLKKEINYGVALSPYIDSLSGGIVYNSLNPRIESKSQRYRWVNTPIVLMYQRIFFTKHNWIEDKRVVIESKRPESFLSPLDAIETQGISMRDRKRDIRYQVNFEMTLPLFISQPDAIDIMKDNLDRFFIASSAVVEKKVMCLALVKLKVLNTDDYNSSPNAKKVTVLTVFDQDADVLVNLLNGRTPDLPLIINETNFKGKVSMELKYYSNDFESLRQELRKFGFDLIPVERQLEMLELKDLRKL